MRLLLLICFTCFGAKAATITAASVAYNDVIAALALAATGDTVQIPAGSNRWASGTNWVAPASVTLKGAGTSETGGGDQTVIVDDYSSGSPLLDIDLNASGVFRLTGITFQSGTGSTKDNGTISLTGPTSGSTQVRVDHCHLRATSAANYQMMAFWSGIFGVMDRCILNFTDTRALYFYNGRRGGTADTVGNYEWSQPTDIGGATHFYIEDNIILGTNSGSVYSTRLYDATSSAKVVVRFNNLVQSSLGEVHATGHAGNDRGARSQEHYCNSVTSTLTVDPNFAAVDMSSGPALVWGNSWDQVFKSIYRFNVTRKNSATYAQTPPATGWGYAGPLKSGTVNVTGTAVTWASGDNFDVAWPAGLMIYVVGMTAEGVTGQEPADGPTGGIASVGSTTALTLCCSGHTGGPLTGAAYSIGAAWDVNTDSLGYPALDQPARGYGAILTNDHPNKINLSTGTIAWPTQALEQIYIWNNTGGYVAGWGNLTYSDVSSGRVVTNRDFYAATTVQTSSSSPFNGTAGMGFGTLANRPTTCTVGVSYFATDQGSWNTSTTNYYGVQQNGADGVLYKCTATDTWTLYYTPYTYPHPLTVETASVVGTRPPPLNLKLRAR